MSCQMSGTLARVMPWRFLPDGTVVRSYGTAAEIRSQISRHREGVFSLCH